MILDYIAAACTVAGIWMMGDKDWRGFLVTMTGSGLWMTYAFLTDQWPLLITNVAIVAVEIRAVYKWLQDE